MSERRSLDINRQSVKEIAEYEGLDGNIASRLLMIMTDNNVYLLRVGLPEYIRRVKNINAKNPDPDTRLDEIIFPLPDMKDFEVVVERLKLVAVHPENLTPYLKEVEIEEH